MSLTQLSRFRIVKSLTNTHTEEMLLCDNRHPIIRRLSHTALWTPVYKNTAFSKLYSNARVIKLVCNRPFRRKLTKYRLYPPLLMVALEFTFLVMMILWSTGTL